MPTAGGEGTVSAGGGNPGATGSLTNSAGPKAAAPGARTAPATRCGPLGPLPPVPVSHRTPSPPAGEAARSPGTASSPGGVTVCGAPTAPRATSATCTPKCEPSYCVQASADDAGPVATSRTPGRVT